MGGYEQGIRGINKFSAQTLRWMITSRKMKIKSLKKEIKLLEDRIKQLGRKK